MSSLFDFDVIEEKRALEEESKKVEGSKEQLMMGEDVTESDSYESEIEITEMFDPLLEDK